MKYIQERATELATQRSTRKLIRTQKKKTCRKHIAICIYILDHYHSIFLMNFSKNFLFFFLPPEKFPNIFQIFSIKFQHFMPRHFQELLEIV